MISRTNHSRKGGQVSIPMTVLGGLQSINTAKHCDHIYRFNTDDGIRRAAILLICALDRTVCRFNTDDGIRRAAMFSI